MDKQNLPLSIIMENGKSMMTAAFNRVQNQVGLPAYLMEGILLDLLCEVRNKKNLELIADVNRMNQKNDTAETKETEESEKEDGENNG